MSARATGESGWLLIGLTGMGAIMGLSAFWVVVTHEAAEENLTSSIDSIANLDSVSSVTSTIRVYL